MQGLENQSFGKDLIPLIDDYVFSLEYFMLKERPVVFKALKVFL